MTALPPVEQITPPLCSKCKLNPTQGGQRWCRACRTASQAEKRKAETEARKIRIDDLIPDGHNANLGTTRGRKMVNTSLRKGGAGRSILVDKNLRVIAGNKTLAEAKALGMKVRVIQTEGDELVVVQRMELDLETDDKAKELAIADNRAGEVGLEWDGNILADFGTQFDLGDLFTPKELGKIAAGMTSTSTATDDAPDRPKKPKTKPGDFYILGDHRLLCADATKADAYGRLMQGESAHLCWTDPPYNVAYEGKTKEKLKIQNDKMGNAAFAAFLNAAFAHIASTLLPGGGIYVAHADLEGLNFRQSFVGAGLQLSECLIWAKNSMVMGRFDYHWQHEPILYGWKPGAGHHWYSNRKQTTLLEFERPTRSTEHPTMKPVALVEYCVKNSTAVKQNVLDPFGGSGTTLMACEASNRRCFTMELDRGYCDVIVERWETATGRKAELVRA